MSPSPWRAAPILGVPRVRAAAEYYRDVLGFSLDPVDGVFQPSPSGLVRAENRHNIPVNESGENAILLEPRRVKNKFPSVDVIMSAWTKNRRSIFGLFEGTKPRIRC